MNRNALTKALNTTDLVFSNDTFAYTSEAAHPDAVVPWRTINDLTSEQLAAYNAAVAEDKPLVSYWAIQNALEAANLLATLEGIIEGLPDTPDNRSIQRKWRNAEGRVRFNHPHTKSILAALTQAVGPIDVDAIWDAAIAEQQTA